MSIRDRYATAIRSSRLVSDPRSTFSDVDVLIAYGLADRTLKENGHPLCVALERLFNGVGSTDELLAELVRQLRRKAPSMNLRLRHFQAVDIAKACVAWHRDKTCKPCGGHGWLVVPGTTSHGNRRCPSCRGDKTIARQFDRAMPVKWHAIAQWLIAAMEREMDQAGTMAMRKINGNMSL